MVEQVEFLQSLHDVSGRFERTRQALKSALQHAGRFALAIGSTETSDVPGISAAGADAESRRLTPAIDAEAIVIGMPLSAPSLPVSPAGIVSPVVLSSAMLNLLNCKIDVYDCGAFIAPKLETLKVGGRPARRLETGKAQDIKVVETLFKQGQLAGEHLASKGRYVIVGECVPAGTTTALGVLTALGYPAHKLVSSSMPSNDHVELRFQLVEEGLRNAGLTGKAVSEQPLLATAAVGDPMQPFVAGLALRAAAEVPVVLAGGTQMLAVYALAQAVAGAAALKEANLAVITTKWVAFDEHSDAAALAELVGAPFAAACPDFHASKHEGLRAYEEGNVKEGTGAGGLMALAHLAGFSGQRIVESIDLQYDRMVLARRS